MICAHHLMEKISIVSILRQCKKQHHPKNLTCSVNSAVETK